MNNQKLAEYGGKVLPNGTMEMRDSNDNARHRYQYALIDGVPSHRTLPDKGDYNPPSQWEPLDLFAIAAIHQGHNPILDYSK